MSYLAKASLWVFLRSLAGLVYVMEKLLSKANYLLFLMTLSQLFQSIGKRFTLRAMHYLASNPQLQLEESTEGQESEDDDEDRELAEGPQMNGSPEDKTPVIRSEDGRVIPLCYEPLPEFVIFKALFADQYGPHGRCPVSIGDRAAALGCEELYSLLQGIQADPAPSPMLKALYGAMISVIVHRFNVPMTSKTLN